MRRGELERLLRSAAREHGVHIERLGGTRHDHWRVGGTVIRLPRHHEISVGVRPQILRALENEFGEGWWR